MGENEAVKMLRHLRLVQPCRHQAAAATSVIGVAAAPGVLAACRHMRSTNESCSRGLRLVKVLKLRTSGMCHSQHRGWQASMTYDTCLSKQAPLKARVFLLLPHVCDPHQSCRWLIGGAWRRGHVRSWHHERICRNVLIPGSSSRG